MSWWSKNTKLVIASAIILMVAFGAFIAYKIRGPLFCTLVGCSGGLHVEVTNLPASSPFQISITLPFGKTRTLLCDPNNADQVDSFEQSCSPSGAYFQLPTNVKPPKRVTVAVTADGKTVTQIFTPTYEKFQPNGAGCEPTCYSASLEFKFAQ